ncbi:MAG: glycoside hydrolase family 2 protein, partial [Promethearchaeota archaeon]
IKLGRHEGGYLPFRMQFSPRLLSLTGENYLAVRVDAGLYTRSIPGIEFDGFQWGGIHRPVKLLVLERTRVRKIKITTQILSSSSQHAMIKIDFDIRNPQEFLDKCYARQVVPEITYELNYLGRFFNGEAQFNPVLIQTGTQEIRLESLRPLSRVSHDRRSLIDYFADVKDQSEIFEERVDLETYFSFQPVPVDQDTTNNGKKSDFAEKQREETVADLTNTIIIRVSNPAIWTPETPELYSLKFRLHGIDQDKFVRFGIRKIDTIKTGLFLNNRGVRLRGINYHEENIAYGRSISPQDRRKDLLKMKALGFNAIRLPRYPHDQILLDLTDEEGIFVVEEIPYQRHIRAKDKQIWRQYAHLISTLILRDYNHPSVIMWALGQEVSTDQLDHRRLMSEMLIYAKRLDNSRLISYSSKYLLHDPLRSSLPVNLIHTSFGDEYGSPNHMSVMFDVMYASHPQTPWIITHFGTSTKRETADASSNSEQKQTQDITRQIQIFNSKPYIAGWFLNSFRDYRSGTHTRTFEGGFNRTGIYDEVDRPKFIVKILARIVNDYSKPVTVSRIFAQFLGPFLFILYEKLFCRKSKSTTFRGRKKVRQFYSTSPLKLQ